VGAVAVLAVVAFLMMNRGGAGTGADPTVTPTTPQQQASGTTQPPAGNVAPTGAQTPTNRPSGQRTTPGQTPVAANQPGTTTQPPADASMVMEDSLAAADAALRAESNGVARAAALFVYRAREARAGQKARAAKMVAETYANENNTDSYVEWLRNALRYSPNDAAALEALRRMGIEP